MVAPLDWGLGHATRCIPVIRQLLQAGCTVFIAADGKVKALLEAEFRQVRFLHLPGYAIRYNNTALGTAFTIVAQIPKIMRAIKSEETWLQRIVQKERIDAVISDNRFGLYHPKLPTVFITHQLRIKAPYKIVEVLLQQLNYSYIQRFSECWVPDDEGPVTLSGLLSHPQALPKITVRYTGSLSRFEKGPESGGDTLLIILSGPEPQRTLLEKIVVANLKDYTEPAVLVRGLPQATDGLEAGENVSVFNHLPAAELAQKIRNASFIISRCGYSTVMDLAATGKKGILIPTPGQTEQEYLATHLMKQNFALCIEQKGFRLRNALELAQAFAYNPVPPPQHKLKEVVEEFLNNISKRKSVRE